jgi:hypothetical protein
LGLFHRELLRISWLILRFLAQSIFQKAYWQAKKRRIGPKDAATLYERNPKLRFLINQIIKIKIKI